MSITLSINPLSIHYYYYYLFTKVYRKDNYSVALYGISLNKKGDKEICLLLLNTFVSAGDQPLQATLNHFLVKDNLLCLYSPDTKI